MYFYIQSWNHDNFECSLFMLLNVDHGMKFENLVLYSVKSIYLIQISLSYSLFCQHL